MTTRARAVLLSLFIIIVLSACGSPDYTPEPSVLATREAAEYATAQARGGTAWDVILGFTIIILAIISFMAWRLGGVRYHVADAGAREAYAKARRAMLVDLGNGAVLDLETNTIRATNHVTAPQIQPAMRAEPLPQQTQPNGIQRFVLEAASIAGWDSDVIPRWARWSEKGYTMTGAEWMRQTDELVRLGLIEKTPGADTTVIDGDLRWMYSQLPPSPTDGQQPFAR